MKNLKNLGKALTKVEQRSINGGVFACGGGHQCPPGWTCPYDYRTGTNWACQRSLEL
ncbi:hypothetical protein [Lacinutrix sp. Hel_I_90]|uniref:hypothetical protein n=1 Tax=Lacinutrix sp. Hel_I_90 TaxID=1249999 RepID=UPI000B16535F|nr:hypothetical protein [Lacinutrix sp. Hel_I_90]